MLPGYDCAASVLLCAEDNAAILGLDDEGEESSWAGATPPRDTVVAAAAAAAGIAADGFLTEFPLQSDECVAALVERETEHMPVEGYPQKLQRRYGGLDLAAVRRDAVDWIWKVIDHYNFAPLTAVLSVNYLDRFLSTYELPEGNPWMTQLLAVACLSLASKMEETFAPLPLDLQVPEAKFVFEGRTIKRMELVVLSTLKWRMHAVTACSFIEYFLHKLSDLGVPSLLARSRSADLILSTAKGAEFVVFRPSEIAASVALAAIGECRSSVIERAATSCKYLDKERVLRCHEMIKEKITMGSIILKSAGSSISSVPQSPIGVLDAAACLSQQSDDATVGSPATCYHSSSTSKRRRITRRLL
ncbi:hypothetical protein SETIT_1G327700v2 [Setaria italica]|uniref:Uncharacterized protein n=1 Tax=Setaria italica TaxID=4555 RepID=K3YTK8_SETIT|nr:cyclin-D3-1 [Setaria italica]RCV08452.1 hypothetical protein SETIT_1G327700v2 [Setaria italica]